MDGGSRCCHPWLSFPGDDALMPVPLIALGLAAGSGLATGYVIDHFVGDSKYTAQEAVLDASLGVVGGSLISPTLRIGQRLNTSVRISRGRPTAMERVLFWAKTEKVFSHKREAALWAMYRTGTQSGSDIKRIGKFYGVSGGHSYYLASRGSGAPSRASSTRTASRPDTKGAREFLRRQGRGPPQDRKYGGPRKSMKRGGRSRRSGKQRCPPGHYWSKRYKKCVRYRKY
jgi:hypothetical protein